MTSPVRVVLADDHALFRHGLRLLLGLEAGVEVVAEVERAADLETTLARSAADVLLLDLQMERSSIADIEALARSIRVVVVTASERTEDALEAVQLGACAVVQKRFAAETLLQAIQVAAQGLVWLPTELQAELAKRWREPSVRGLTAREREIVRLVASGFRNAEVAKRLSIGEVTVKTHLNNVFQKLDVRDRVELTRWAIRNGVVGIHDRDR